MKKRFLLVLALVAALSLVAAAPVSADGERPINGKMDLYPLRRAVPRH